MERIEWTDSGMGFAISWMSQEELMEKAKGWDGSVVTVGHVVYEDERCVVIAHSVDPVTDNVSGCMLIYKSCINKRVSL